MGDATTLRLGTRGSALARWQAEWVAARLTALGVDVELVVIKTQGDARSGPIGAIGTQGVFTKEIQSALLDGRADLAVHSLKDLPTEPQPGLALAAVPPREANGDALISRGGERFDELKMGARIGTGSQRRRAQLLYRRDDLEVIGIRGNVETRLAKLDAGDCDAIVLAEAGLRRLRLADRIVEVLPTEWMLPAIGQGALGIEIRRDDELTRPVVAQLDDRATHHAVLAERAMLATLRGGCLAPIGGWARNVDQGLRLDGVVLSTDGQQRIAATATAGGDHSPIELGQCVAGQLFEQGAESLIAGSR